MDKREAFRKRLLATFRGEAEEHIRALSAGLLELERQEAGATHAQTLETIFREAHSLKGAARAVNVSEMERVCQSMESVFAAWQRGTATPEPGMFDLLHRAMDLLERVLRSSIVEAEGGGPGPGRGEAERMSAELEEALRGAPVRLPRVEARNEVVEQIATVVEPVVTAPAPVAEAEVSRPEARVGGEARVSLGDTVRVPAERLNALLLEVEELLMARLAAEQWAAEAEGALGALSAWRKTRRQGRELTRALMQESAQNGHGENGGGGERSVAALRRLLESQEQDEQWFRAVESRLNGLAKMAQRDGHALERMVDSLLDTARKAVMLPASVLLEGFPRVARELSRDRGKIVELEVQGGEIEIDRRILEEMKDPLLHLVRNCIDHGIETPEERRSAGKAERGTVRIALRRKDSGNVELTVSDDGRGIQTEAVRAAAAKMGLMPREESAEENESLMEMVFRSGLSTSPIITDLSGRGLGLTIARERAERVGGEIQMESRPGAGTTFRIRLPFTRAAFRGVVVRVDEQYFVLPSMHVERVLRFRRDDVKTVENRETIVVEGKPTALVELREALELTGRRTASELETGQAVLLGSGDSRIAVAVEEVLDEQEVLAKPLGKQLAGMRNVAEATVLGNGRVVPILDVGDVMESARTAGAAVRKVKTVEQEAEAKRSILVAEDSITARTLLKNILETAGYAVQTAVDGAEAFATLKTGEFDLVVSDVDMPRLNGFGLVAKVRSDAKLAKLPVVLVTSLGTREDRERGIDAGANAYIVKSSFDQSNLLEVIQRLL